MSHLCQFCVHFNWLFSSSLVIFSHFFSCLLVLECMPDIVNFNLLNAWHFCIPENLEFCPWMHSIFLEIVGSFRSCFYSLLGGTRSVPSGYSSWLKQGDLPPTPQDHEIAGLACRNGTTPGPVPHMVISSNPSGWVLFWSQVTPHGCAEH